MAASPLLENLTNQVSCYGDLLKVARKKRAVLVEGQVQQLDKLLAVEQALVLKSGRFEEERQHLVAQILPDHDPGAVTLGALLAVLSEEEQVTVQELESRLQETLTQLKEENLHNQELIRQSLDYIDFSLGLLSKTQVNLLDQKA